MSHPSARPASSLSVSRSRRRLQWTLAALAAMPVASASGEIVRGPEGVPGGSPDVLPTVDSALRYANAFKFAVGSVIWSQLAHVESSPAAMVTTATGATAGRATAPTPRPGPLGPPATEHIVLVIQFAAAS